MVLGPSATKSAVIALRSHKDERTLRSLGDRVLLGSIIKASYLVRAAGWQLPQT